VRNTWLTAPALGILLWLANATPEVLAQKAAGTTLPNFDKRPKAPAAAPARPGGLKAQGTQPDLQVKINPVTGSPRLIQSPTGFLTEPDSERLRAAGTNAPEASPEGRVKTFVQANQNLFGHGREALNAAEMKRNHEHNGLRTIQWEQRWEGIPVFQGVFVANLNRESRLIKISSGLLRDPAAAAEKGMPEYRTQLKTPQITPEEAVILAAKNLGLTVAREKLKREQQYGDTPEQRQIFRAIDLKGETRAKLVWLPTSPESARLCWQIELRAGRETYRILIDAASGAAWLRQSMTLYLSDATYRVFTRDSPTPFSPGHERPQNGQPAAMEREILRLGALSTNASPSGWIADGENETAGNNVDAHTDWNDDDLPDLPRPQGTPRRVFDFPMDLAQAPRSHAKASVVQLFYWNNWMHDRLYELGFTEAAGNFQKNNFGRGGEEGDAVEADAQDGGGFNNANFTPSSDGIPGRMQMYLFDGPAPDRDGSLDAEVVIHEYVHGLSTRLVGGGNALNELQSGGMGEGWSDFYALALLSESSDAPGGAYAAGAYLSYQLDRLEENYYFGIRRYPYSTDLQKNPLTFKDIDPSQASSHAGIPRNPIYAGFDFPEEVHAQGEVWCVTLWDARANLIQQHGFEAGNQLILQLVTDGLKLTPPEPTFLEARDAIIQADLAANGGANREALWAAFAKRGMGFSAEGPPSSTTVGVVEAFDVPDDLLVRPISPLAASGPEGGPFSPGAQTYILQNVSTNLVRWTAVAGAPWLELSRASGVMEPGAVEETVTVSLNALVSSLPAGVYTAGVVFSNSVTGRTQARTAAARIAQPNYLTSLISSSADPDTHRHASIAFTPAPAPDYYTACYGKAEEFPTDPIIGAPLELGDDDFAEVKLADGKQILFYGEPHTNFFVGANGYITFGAGVTDFSPTLESHFSLPRISGFFTDLDPSSGGIVSWVQLPDRVAVTFEAVPLYFPFDEQNFQIEMHFDGTIRVTWLETLSEDGIAGLSRGTGIPSNFSPTAFASIGACLPSLVVSLPPSISEADASAAGQVRIPAPLATNLAVRVESFSPKAPLAAHAIIPAGQTEQSFSLPIVRNLQIEGTKIARVAASADGFREGSARVFVDDAESAELGLELAASTREGDAPGAGSVFLANGQIPAEPVIIRLSSSDTNQITVPPVAILTPTQPRAAFEAAAVDDFVIDGTQAVTLAASVPNWPPASARIEAGDNEPRELALELPRNAGEGTGRRVGGGAVSTSGILRDELRVNLESLRPDLLAVPSFVLIAAGASSAVFDLEAKDDATATGPVTALIRASAVSFTQSEASITIFDDETPPVPAGPNPPNLSTNTSPDADLSWSTGNGQALVNGDFETGAPEPWASSGTGSGRFEINDGSLDPEGPGLPQKPYGGGFSIVSQQSGPGQITLFQEATIPAGTIRAELSWRSRIENYASIFAEGFQEFRVEAQSPSGQRLATLFRTSESQPLISDWTEHRADLADFAGEPIRIAFVQEDGFGYFNVHLDEIKLELRSGPVERYQVYFGSRPALAETDLLGTAGTNRWELPKLGLGGNYYWQIVAEGGAARAPGPVWSFAVPAAGPAETFEWAAVPGQVFTGEAFPARLFARDAFGNLATNFNGTVSLRGRQEFPLFTSGRGVKRSDYPLGGFFPISRQQSIYLASELGAARRLTGLALNVAELPGTKITRFTIRLKHTSKLRFTGAAAAWERSGWTVAFQDDVEVRNTGWLEFPFATPFDFDGSSNVLVDLSFKNSTFGIGGTCLASELSTERAMGATEFSGDPLRWSGIDPLPETTRLLPNIQFRAEIPVPIAPAVSGNFLNGVWEGSVALEKPASGARLIAEDPQKHQGFSSEISASVKNDAELRAREIPARISLGDVIRYEFTVRNSGPEEARDLVMTNTLGRRTRLVSVEASQGAFTTNGAELVFHLGTLPGGAEARIQFTATSDVIGILTNLAVLERGGSDAFAANNTATSRTAVLPRPSLRVEDAAIAEMDGTRSNLVFAVSLSSESTLPVSVDYETPASTTDTNDFQFASGTLTIPPGNTEGVVLVKIYDDMIDEQDETFRLLLRNSTNATLVRSQAIGRIIDDEGPEIRIENASVIEGSGPGDTNIAFRVNLSTNSVQAVTVEFETISGSAHPSSDFTLRTNTMRFPPGMTEQLIAVSVVRDQEIEPNERFIVSLSSPSGATIAAGKAYGTILNDDGLPGDVDWFEFGPIASPQFAGEAFPLNLQARDRFGNPATNFQGSAALSAFSALPPLQVGEGAEDYVYPLDTSYNDLRVQVIYPATDFGPARPITALGLYVRKAPRLTLKRWTIRMKHTALSEYGEIGRWERSGWTVVYQKAERITATGLVVFNFDRPFPHDGVRNVMVDFSFNNSEYDFDGGMVLSTETEAVRAISWASDDLDGDPLQWSGENPPSNPEFVVPNLLLISEQPIALSTNETGIFTNGFWAGTIAVHEPGAGIALRALSPPNAGESTAISVVARDDLGISIQDAPDPVTAGREFTYTLVLTNTGPSPAREVVVTNQLPVLATPLSAIPSLGEITIEGSLLTWRLPEFPGQTSASNQIRVQAPPNPVILTNRAGLSRLEPENYVNNNSALEATVVLPEPAISIAETAAAGEAEGSVRLEALLSVRSSETVTVGYTIEGVTATAGIDFEALPGTLVFPPGTVRQTLAVPIFPDDRDELDEELTVTLENPVNGSIAAAHASTFILDDDGPQIIANSSSQIEGDSGQTQLRFAVTLREPSVQEVSVDFATEDGTAAAGEDFLEAQGTLIFEPGQTSAEVLVSILSDIVIESDESFTLRLTDPINGETGTDPAGAIVNDDGLPGELHSFKFERLPSAVFSESDQLVGILARDGYNNRATRYSGTALLSAEQPVGPVTIGLEEDLWDYPLGGFEDLCKLQTIYRSSEIGQAFEITSLSLFLPEGGSPLFEKFSIRLKPTTLNAFPQNPSWDSTNWVTVVENYAGAFAEGWQVFEFKAPFSYDGTNNLLVEFARATSPFSFEPLLVAASVHEDFCSIGAVAFGFEGLPEDPHDWRDRRPVPELLELAPNIQLAGRVPVLITGPSETAFNAGAWRGTVRLIGAGSGVQLRARDAVGHAGLSDPFALVSTLDSDADQMPDGWERAMGLNPEDPADAAGDLDGDGLSNLQEFLTGTAANDPADHLRILSASLQNGAILIRALVVPGQSYILERSAELTAWPGAEIQRAANAESDLLELAHPIDQAQRAAFYRLKALR